jgi:hypothetical protein
MILAAESDGADRTFDGVVVDLDAPIIEKTVIKMHEQP